MSSSITFHSQGVFSLNQELTNSLHWLLRRPLGSSCLCSTGITAVHCCPWLFHESWGPYTASTYPLIHLPSPGHKSIHNAARISTSFLGICTVNMLPR